MSARACVAFAAALAGCAPAASAPKVRVQPLPAQYNGGGAGPSVASVDWRTVFGDPHLDTLISEALEGNFDVSIALQRIEIARAMVSQARSAQLPQVAVVTSAGIRKYGLFTMDGAGNATTDITPGRRVPEHLPDLFGGLQATWEADLWGRLANLHGAARARYLSSIEGAKLVVSNLVAELAAAYFGLVALDRVQDILTQTIARQTQASEIMRIEKQAGRTNELAVQQFEAQLAGTRALRASIRQQAGELENHINLLLGRMPQAVPRTRDVLERDVARTLATGVPSDLLRNRPDIRSTELQLEAARIDVDAARAAFYPRLSISASLGYQAFDPRFLVRTPESIAYGLVAGLVAPLVNRGGIAAAHTAARATQVEAMYRYQQAVVTSFLEVATSLLRLEQAAEITAQHQRRQEAAAGSIDVANALFRAGKATYLDVLIAQQATLDAQLELVAARRDQHLAAVRLYKALGGGWRGTLRFAAQ